MLIQVTTTHGKPFWCADIRFEPRPKRLWLGDDPPPDRRLPRITHAQLARLERFTGDHGPLFIERGVELADAGDELRELRDQVQALMAERDQAVERVAALAEENESLSGRLAGLEATLAEERAAAQPKRSRRKSS